MSESLSSVRRISVAIVDDVASVRVSLRRICSAYGFDVALYASGREFLESLDAQSAGPDCLVLDAQMPGVNGLEVQKQLVQRGVRFPTLLFTADDSPELIARYVAAGVTACLRKPVVGSELLAAIHDAVGAPAETRRSNGKLD